VHASNGGVLSVSSSIVHATATAIEVTVGGTAEVKASTAIAPEVVANGGTLSVRSSVLAHARAASPPVFISSCGGATKTTFDSTVFVGASTTFTRLDTTKDGPCAASSIATFAATVAGSDASNAIAATATSRIAASCTGEDSASCVADAACAAGAGEGTDCLRAVFAAISDPFFGRAEILSAEGLRLKPMVTCKIAQGGLAFPEIATDAYGAPRTAPISIGAHEYDGACSN
jgi:hypothetical protein